MELARPRYQIGPHLLTVKANVSQQTFWLDQIRYAPSANVTVSLNQSLVRIDSNNSAIQYSPGWIFQDDPISYTTTQNPNISIAVNNGAFLTYEFTGS